MTTRLKIAITAAVAALSLGAATPMLVAQDAPQRRGPGPMAGGPMGGQMRGPGGPGFGLPMRELDLTEDQQAQLQKIREAHAAEFKQAREKVFAARQGTRALIEAETVNEGAIRAKAAEVAAAEAEVAILSAKVRQESLQILTSEQQQKLKELRESRAAAPMKRRGPRGQ